MQRNIPIRPSHLFPCGHRPCRKLCRDPGALRRHENFNPPTLAAALLPPAPPIPAAIPDDEEHPGQPGPPPVPPPMPDPYQAPVPPVYRLHRSNEYIARHPYMRGRPCNSEGVDLAEDEKPQPRLVDQDDYYPFTCEQEYNLARWIFRRAKLSNPNVDELMEILGDLFPGQYIPWSNFAEFYETVDAIPVGGVPWTQSTVKYDGVLPPNAPPWMTETYEFWFRNPLEVLEEQLANPEFAEHIDYAPKRMFRKEGRRVIRRFRDLMSGDWAWEEADALASETENHGAMFAPIVLGSDKTTVSVATGQNEYYPLYASLGNLQNHARRAHRDGVAVIGFLAMPKADHSYRDSAQFRKFRRQLMHRCLVRILSSLKPWMTKARVTLCGDGHYRRVIYGLGPYIADYPEHCLLSGIVYGWCPKCTALRTDLDGDPQAVPRSHTHSDLAFEAKSGKLAALWDEYGLVADIELFTTAFPRADIHNLLTPDLLHQVIKGVFKDHLVTWIIQWMEAQQNGKELLDDFDHRIAAAPSFTGVRRFPQGRNFKQWTGDDSKALMKVIIPALDGLVPVEMVRAVSTFMDFCYIARRSLLEEPDLEMLDDLLNAFHEERKVFFNLGIRPNFNLPRQHSLKHYALLIQRFGAPNGLCASITESKHIDAVKDPYRRSNKNQPMDQMLTINERNARMQALEQYFLEHEMLARPFRALLLPDAIHPPAAVPYNENDDFPEEDPLVELSRVRLPRRPGMYHQPFPSFCLFDGLFELDTTGYDPTLFYLQQQLEQPKLHEYIRRFLFDQFHPDSAVSGWDVDLAQCPWINPNLYISMYYRARITYISPSEPTNLRSVSHEFVRAVPGWQGDEGRHDCVFLYNYSDRRPGFAGLHVAQVHIFFSFEIDHLVYPCALVHWFTRVGDEPSPNTRMWVVEPALDNEGQHICSVEHIDSIARAAHLMGVYGQGPLPRNVTFKNALHAFRAYHVNKFIDHHAHEIAF
ncbi:hypothetical protein BDN72DRAFT_872243 [Pluteus cervinus]|uniref:Uncharacterized protein n=1 Tax=Pluteus cervinus TaxID=181527 RepID=A0ACD3AEJ4_9AGAR|nr:hypothetical protein BDN72DRAFT_872243 [Pluteus cervinus]